MSKRPTLEEVEMLFTRRFQPLKITIPKSHPAIPQGPAVLSVPQDERPRRALNKTEEEWGRRLAVLSPSSRVFVQPTRFFALRGGGTYTPDFLEFRPDGLPVIAWEVKGGYRGPGWEQGYERYRRAALEFSGAKFAFKLAEKRKGKWSVTEWK